MGNARDTEDLEALFDQISSETLARINDEGAPAAVAPTPAPAAVVARAPVASGTSDGAADPATPAESEQAEFVNDWTTLHD
jgi:thiamine biosynthesis lipoprotein ApbE